MSRPSSRPDVRPNVRPDVRPAAATGPLFARLWRGYLRQHRGRMALAFAVMALEGATLGALSWLLKPLFDSVFVPGGTGSLMLVGLAILGLFALRAVTSVFARWLVTGVSQATVAALQVDLLRHILRLDQGFWRSTPPGLLIERVQGDTQAVQALWTTVLTGAARDIFALLGLMAVALTIDPLWTAAALVGVPALILPVVAVQRYVRRKARAVRAEAGQRATRLDEVFHGIQAVKLNRIEDFHADRFARIVARIKRMEMRMSVGRATVPALIDIVTGLGFFAVLMLAGPEIAAGNRTVGDFMAFFSAMALAFQPVRRLGEIAGTWQVAAASVERIFALFDAPTETRALPPPPRLPGRAPEIRVEDLRFAYAGQPVLDGLTFTARAGEITALVGPSGAGKSTLFALLTGLVQPDAGRITLDGIDAATLPLPDLRATFAVVSQETALFDETLRENVTLGRATPDDRLQAALAAAHVTDFLPGLAQGIDTPAGPRGSGLSGGQRQRVAIARAVLADAPVLLLDEATSALDAASEALVAEALARLSSGRTTLVVAHRLATIRDAQRIVVVDRGRVADVGTHDELLARGGLYAELCRLQFRD